MKGRSLCLSAVLVSAMLIVSLAPVAGYLSEGGTENVNEGWWLGAMTDPADLEAAGYIPISTPYDLAKIGNDAEYPLSGKYYLTNDILFDGIDTNGGVDMELHADIQLKGSLSDISVTLVPSGGLDVTSLYAWIGNISDNDGSGSVLLEDVPWGMCTLIIGGELSSGDLFAYHITLDTSTGGTITETFSSNGNFDPIGGITERFSGTFDGNGHVIVGMDLAVFNDTDAVIRMGMFGTLDDAIICNLGVVKGSVTGVHVAQASGDIMAAGAILGTMTNYSSVTNCYNTSSVATASTVGWAYAAGVAGSSGHATLDGCFNAGHITASAAWNTRVGGVLGVAASANLVVVKNCYNAGPVSAYTSVDGSAAAGGVVGSLSSTSSIFDSYNVGPVMLENAGTGGSYAGGVLGICSPTAVRCYNTGDVTARASSSGFIYIGGVSGNGGAIQSYNTGNIDAVASSGAIRIGGISGSPSSLVMDCYNTGEIYGEAPSGGAAAGGIVGYSTSQITNCYNTGDIRTLGSSRAGGIAGQVAGAITVTNCYYLTSTIYWSGSVTPTTDYLVGTGTAEVDGTSSPPRGTHQGSAAKTEVQMRNVDLNDAKGNLSIYYTGETTLSTSAIRPGWDLNSIWTIDPEINNGYPILQTFVISLISLADPEDQDVIAGDNAMFLTASELFGDILVQPSDMTPQYQWYEVIGGSFVKMDGAIGGTYSVNNVTAADNGRQFSVSIQVPGYNGGEEIFSDIATLNVFLLITVSSNAGGHHQYMIGGDGIWKEVVDGKILVPAGLSIEIKGVPNDLHKFQWHEDLHRDYTVGAGEVLFLTPTHNMTVSGEFTGVSASGCDMVIWALLISSLILLFLIFLGRRKEEEEEEIGDGNE